MLSAGAKGFTFVELIAVIVVLGILSVLVIPRFIDRGGFSEATYQARLISALRNMQMRAMQDSRTGFCFQINFNANGASNPAFGAPTLDYSGSSNTCATSIDYSLGDSQSVSYTSETEMADDGLTMDVQDFSQFPSNRISSIGFDGLGQPIAANNGSALCTNNSECVVTISGETNRFVCINSQGYIYAGDSTAC